MSNLISKGDSKSSSGNVRDEDLQEANAHQIAIERMKNSTNNGPLYIVTVEDPSATKNVRKFAALKLKEQSITVDVEGFEVTSESKLKKINGYQEALTYVENEKSVSIEYVRFPWTKIISIKNITKQNQKEK